VDNDVTCLNIYTNTNTVWNVVRVCDAISHKQRHVVIVERTSKLGQCCPDFFV